MYYRILEHIRDVVKKAIHKNLIDEIDVYESEVADFSSTIAFRLSRKLKKSPIDIAFELSKKIKPEMYVEKVEARNGYLNFYLGYEELFPEIIREVRTRGSDYGRALDKRKRIILEHTSINPSGPVHIGRLRNSLIGDAIARILRFNGFEVETHYYVNDTGKQIAIIFQGFRDGIRPDRDIIKFYEKYKEKDDFVVFFEYVAANKRFETDSKFADRVESVIRRIENGDEKILDEISSIARKCLNGQREIFDKLNIKFDKFDFESDYIREGRVRDVINFLKKSKYWRVTEIGSGLDLREFGIEKKGGVSIIERSDGTSVYLTRDVAYHLEKSKLGDILLNVLGEDHKLEFLELKTILTKIYKLSIPINAIHYSFVNFEGMELSTRKGLIAPVDKLIDEAIEKAEREIEKRGVASRDIAPKIGIGAIKYHILRTTPSKPITFRWEEALHFDGESAPYIQYAHARCCRILEKADVDIDTIDVSSLKIGRLEIEERNLLFQILRFPNVVERAGNELRPNIIANYLYDLASCFNRFYKECQVLRTGRRIRERRLLLVDCVRIILSNGLDLLGIDAPERM